MVDAALVHNRFAERLRADGAVLAIIDGQADLLATAVAPVGGTAALHNNLMGLARLGHAFNLPTVLGVCTGAACGPVLDELVDLFGAAAIAKRRAGAFWDDPASREAVLAHGRRHLIVASLTPAFGIAETALGARGDGLEVHAVLDASAGSSDGAGRIGMARMTAAGVRLTSWVAVLAELGATCVDIAGGNGAAAVRDNLDRYTAVAATLT